MFNDLLRLKEAPLQETFEKVNIHGKKFVAVKYDGRTIGLANKETSYELKSPYMNEVPTGGIMEEIKQAFTSPEVPMTVKDIVMYIRGLMVEV